MNNDKFTLEKQLIMEIARNVYIDNFILREDHPLINKVDWDFLMQQSLLHKIFPLFYRSIRHVLPQKVYNKYKNNYSFMAFNTRSKIESTYCLIDKAQSDGIVPCVAKGFILSQIIYSNPYIRQFNDVDIYVANEEIFKVSNIINKMGYVDDFVKSINYDFDSSYINNYYLTRGELKFRSHDTKLLIEVKKSTFKVDNISMKYFLSNVISINVHKTSFKTFDLLHTFLYLIVNACKNFNTTYGIFSDYILRDLIDVYCFLRRHPYIHQLQLYEVAEKHGMLPCLKYVLSMIEELFGGFETLTLINNTINNIQPISHIVSWESDFISRLFNHDERISEWKTHRINSLRQNGYAYVPIIINNEDNINRYDGLYPVRMSPELLFRGIYGEVYFGLFNDGDYLFIRINTSSKLCRQDFIIKIGFLTIEKKSGSLYRIIRVNLSDSSTIILKSDVEEVEILKDITPESVVTTVKVPINNKDICLFDEYKRRMFIYIGISRNDDLLSYYSWGSQHEPIQLVL